MAAKTYSFLRLDAEYDIPTVVVETEWVHAMVDKGIDSLIVLSPKQGRFIIPVDDLLEADGAPITLRGYKA